MPQDQLLFFHISGSLLPGFTHSETSPSHEFQEHPVAWVRFLENDFIDSFLLQNLPGCVLRGPEDLSDHRKVAGIVQLRIARIADECEERGQRRVTGSLGSLLCAFADFRKEGEDFLGRDRFQIPVAESGRELG